MQLESVDIHLVQMNALTRQRMDKKALGCLVVTCYLFPDLLPLRDRARQVLMPETGCDGNRGRGMPLPR